MSSSSFFIIFLLLSVEQQSPVRAGHPIKPRNCRGVPHHVHLATGPDEPATSMIVSFASVPSSEEAPVAGVAIGTSPGVFDYIVVASDSDLETEEDNDDAEESTTITSAYHVPVHKGDGNGPPSKQGQDQYWSPHYHHVTLSNLQPDTIYYYQPVTAATRSELKVVNHNDNNLRSSSSNKKNQDKEHDKYDKQEANAVVNAQVSIDNQGERRFLSTYDTSKHGCPKADKVRWFRTPPLPSPNAETVLAVIGDLGQSPHAAVNLQDLHDTTNGGNINVILLVGDISYAGTSEHAWDVFFDFWDDMALPARVPIHICPGNHDVEPHKNKAMFQAYEHRFRMPRVASPQLDKIATTNHREHPYYPLPYDYGNAYHEFVQGAAHVFLLSAYSSMEPNSKQYTWLTDALQNKVDRNVTPWLIVGIHVPIYNTYHEHRDDPQVLAALQHLEPLFVEHRVNVVVSGHVHAYMRTQPVVYRNVDPQGPVYMIVGSSGYQASGKCFQSATPEDWVAARDETRYGYGTLHIHNATAATWTWRHTDYGSHLQNRVFDSNQTLATDFDTDTVVLHNQLYA